MGKTGKTGIGFSGSRVIGLIIGIIIPIVFSFFPTPEPLQPKAWLAIGLLLGAVVWIITKTFRDYQAMIIMCCLLVVTKCVSFGTAFGSFAGTSWWMMFGALGIGVAAVECGFMKRIAYLMLKVLPSSFRGQCLAYIFSGAIISPIMPSSTAKGVIMAPLAKNTSDALGFQPHSRGAQGMFIAMYSGYVGLALIFLSGSAVNVSIAGTMPAGYEVGWMKWFTTLLPWGIVFAVLMILVLFKFYAPKNASEGRVSQESVQAELDKMGPWSAREKITLVTLLAALALWILESQIGLSSTVVAMIAFIFLFASGVTTPDKLKSVGWEPLFFVGAFLCLPNVFKDLGINDFISGFLGDKVAPIMSNMFLLVPFIAILTYVIRLVFVSTSGTTILITTIFLPFCAQYGIHPFVIAATAYMSTNTWNVSYQNTQTVAALAANGPEWLTNRDVLSGSVWYMIINVIALFCSIPYWKILGMC